MSLYIKIILVLFGLAYLISPVDVIPDLLLPYIGWVDDAALIAALVYLIRTGKLPNFFFKKPGPSKTNYKSDPGRNQQNENNNSKQQKRDDSAKRKRKTPYEILGIRPGATKREIQSAYKEAIKKYHPDKLSHLGEEFSTLANEKFLEIQEAYDSLMKYY